MTCARCLVSFATRADHAAHLIEVHGLAGGVALVEARIPPGEFAAFSAAILAHPTPILPSQAEFVSALADACSGTTAASTITTRTAKEPPMPTGQYQRTNDPTKPCGYCHQPKDAHARGCVRQVGAPPRAPKAPGKAKTRPNARNGKALASVPHATNGADPIAAIRAALLQLDYAELVALRAFRDAMAKALSRQGHDPTLLDETAFTDSGKRQAIGNGVPMAMGRAIARAVRKALGA
jgi:hypothetical protein